MTAHLLSKADWEHTQGFLIKQGYDVHGVDGVAGSRTYTCLMAYGAGVPVSDALVSRGQQAALLYPRAELLTSARITDFLAQCINETGRWTAIRENLDYSAQRCAEVWPTRYAVDPHAEVKTPNALALKLARNPQALANNVYARPEEGNTGPNDGWLFRGGFDIELTFKNNWLRMAHLSGYDLVNHPELANDPAVSHAVAVYFWMSAGINPYCDAGDFRAARSVANVGLPHPKADPVGLQNVESLREHLMLAFAA